MRKRGSIIFITVFLSCFFIFTNSNAENSDVMINEIGAYEGVDNEWIEIWNSGSGDIDLTDWKFWEDSTNHGLLASSTDAVLSPGEYGAICQDEETFLINYPGFSGSVFDSSWGSLKEGGEEIGLKDEIGNFVENFTYLSAPDFSLERKNPFLADYTSDNWIEHNSGNSLGVQNSVYDISRPENILPVAILNVNTTSLELGEELLFDGSSSYDDDGEIVSWVWDFGDNSTSSLESGSYFYSTTGSFNIFLNVTDEDNATSTASTSIYVFQNSTTTPSSTAIWDNIKINEIISNPESGNEKVELFSNSSSGLDLTGGVICDSTESNCKNISGVISGDGFLVVDLETSRYLNNDGDFVILKDNEGNKIDEVVYGSSLESPEKGEALARKIDGADSNNISDWAITTSITLGSENIITAPVVNPPSGGGGSTYIPPVNTVDDNLPPEADNPECFASSSVIIYEVLPNPVGDDLIGEYIKIKNISLNAINLTGWILKDLAREFELSGEILSEQILEFSRAITSIALNNDDEELSLVDGCGNVISKLNYEKVEEGVVFNYENKSLPGEAEERSLEDSDGVNIVWNIDYSPSILKGDKVWFDASGSADPRGGNLNFEWQFASSSYFGDKQEFEFNSTGTSRIFISASSSAGTVGQTEVEVLVGERLKNKSDIFIAEVFANPEGVDTREYIKLKNQNTTSTDVSNWQLRYNNKNYIIPDDSFIKAGESLVFYKAVTKFTLSNSGGLVELWNDQNNLVDSFEFAKSAQGETAPEITEDYLAGLVKKEIEKQNKKISNNKKIIRNLNLEQVRFNSSPGDLVRAKGVVNVLPGVFGSQYFYMEDETVGMQIYQYYKDFPDLKIGDEILLSGEVSESSGKRRIKLANKNSIEILSTENSLDGNSFKIDNLDEKVFGKLISLEGEITQAKSSHVYLDDGTGEIKVYFKPYVNMDKSVFVIGRRIKIFGVLELGSTGLELWPRRSGDIEDLGAGEVFLSAGGDLQVIEDGSSRTAEKYLTATAGGISTLLLGALIKLRKEILGGGVKSIAWVASKIVGRG